MILLAGAPDIPRAFAGDVEAVPGVVDHLPGPDVKGVEGLHGEPGMARVQQRDAGDAGKGCVVRVTGEQQAGRRSGRVGIDHQEGPQTFRGKVDGRQDHLPGFAPCWKRGQNEERNTERGTAVTASGWIRREIVHGSSCGVVERCVLSSGVIRHTDPNRTRDRNLSRGNEKSDHVIRPAESGAMVKPSTPGVDVGSQALPWLLATRGTLIRVQAAHQLKARSLDRSSACVSF